MIQIDHFKPEDLLALAKQNSKIDILWLYGSRAKGTAQKTNDYDLAVAFNDFPTDLWEKRLQPEQLAFAWELVQSDV